MLTDLEYRVWTQYLLSADDFGVMRASPAQLQADNDHLGNRPVKVLQRCLDALVLSGLVRAFTHQGKPYIFQHDWMRFQKIEYPRATNNPIPPDLTICDEATRTLFTKHPGGQRKDRRRVEDPPTDLERASQTCSESVPPRGERLTANGRRLPAIGSEGGAGETDPPMDEWARELVNLMHPSGRCAVALVEPPLYQALTSQQLGGNVFESWDALKLRLEEHKRSHQWRVKAMVPRLDRWLRDGTYLQELPEHPPSVLVGDKAAGTLGAAAAILGGKA